MLQLVSLRHLCLCVCPSSQRSFGGPHHQLASVETAVLSIHRFGRVSFGFGLNETGRPSRFRSGKDTLCEHLGIHLLSLPLRWGRSHATANTQPFGPFGPALRARTGRKPTACFPPKNEATSIYTRGQTNGSRLPYTTYSYSYILYIYTIQPWKSKPVLKMVGLVV